MNSLQKINKIALLLVIVGALFIPSFIYLNKEPSSDRVWAEAFQYANHVRLNNDGTATIFDVRDWTYKDGSPYEKEWIPEFTVDPKEIKRAWFLLEPFPEWDKAGHTYLTFEFSDGETLSFSVEARKEFDETYSAFKGLFRTYEISYTWGTERDFLLRRLELQGHEVYMYPLSIKQETARVIFYALLDATNELYREPKFYNTLTANCTNVIAKIINDNYKKQIPYDITWNLPGYSDEFLMKEGYIESPQETLEEVRSHYSLLKYKNTLLSLSHEEPEGFSKQLREIVFQSK